MMPDATQVVVFSFLAGALVALYSACLAGFRIARTRSLPSLGFPLASHRTLLAVSLVSLNNLYRFLLVMLRTNSTYRC